MSEPKTVPTNKSVEKYLDAVENDRRREDSFVLLELLKKITGEEPVLWGDSIVGFGSYHYKYDSGREGDWPLAGFAPRKANLVVYIMAGLLPLRRAAGQTRQAQTRQVVPVHQQAGGRGSGGAGGAGGRIGGLCEGEGAGVLSGVGTWRRGGVGDGR